MGARRERVVAEDVLGYAARRGNRQVRLGRDQPQPHPQRQGHRVCGCSRAGGGPGLTRLGMDRYEEDVDARVGGGPSSPSQDGVPRWRACGQQGIERALKHVRGQIIGDLHRLPLGGRVGGRAPGRLPPPTADSTTSSGPIQTVLPMWQSARTGACSLPSAAPSAPGERRSVDTVDEDAVQASELSRTACQRESSRRPWSPLAGRTLRRPCWVRRPRRGHSRHRRASRGSAGFYGYHRAR
ncbi:hypothetical protein SHIRM173S_05352 [Streptomyces hirsutus]